MSVSIQREPNCQQCKQEQVTWLYMCLHAFTALVECGQLSMCSPLSYCLRFSGSLSTSYAFRSFLNRPSAFALCSSLFCNSSAWLLAVALLWPLGKHKSCCAATQPFNHHTFPWNTNHSANISRRQLSIHQETTGPQPCCLLYQDNQCHTLDTLWTKTHCHTNQVQSTCSCT